MKKVTAAILVVVLLCGLTFNALAASTGFSDISDAGLERDVASLQMLGVIDGYADGRFDPQGTLTRAAFCKMAVIIEGREAEVPLYKNRTIFPDVRAGHWARGYINLAVSGDNRIIVGNGDGTFCPDDPITVAQAVTIMMRILGYKDSDAGMLWPDGYLDLAKEKGLTAGVGLGASGATLTREQAARLFYNLLETNVKGGASYISTLGTVTTNVFLMQLDVSAADGTKDAILTSEGTFKTQRSVLPACLEGTRGTLVKDKVSGKILTFLPDGSIQKTITLASAGGDWIKDTNGVTYSVVPKCTVYMPTGNAVFSEISDNLAAGTRITLYYADNGSVDTIFVSTASSESAIIVGTDDGLSPVTALTGGDKGYEVYKNGVPASLNDMTPYDVVTYDKYSKILRISDFRLSGCYEKCTPNATYPTKITLMGHEFSVLPSAIDSLSKFSVGEVMTILLTSDYQVAGAVRNGTVGATAFGIVDPDITTSSATVKLLNGMTFEGDPGVNDYAAGQLAGELVLVGSPGKGKLSLSRLSGGAVSGSLDVTKKTLGSRQLSPAVLIFERVGRSGVAQISLSDLTQRMIAADRIVYTGLDNSGDVNMLVLNDVTGDLYTYGFIKSMGSDGLGNRLMGVVNGDNLNGTAPVMIGLLQFSEGIPGGLVASCDGQKAEAMISLTAVKNISRSDFYTMNGITYCRLGVMTIQVAEKVQCYNAVNGTWFASQEEMRASADSMTVYYERSPGEGGKIRLIVAG